MERLSKLKNMYIGVSIAPFNWQLQFSVQKQHGEFVFRVGPFVLGGQWK